MSESLLLNSSTRLCPKSNPQNRHLLSSVVNVLETRERGKQRGFSPRTSARHPNSAAIYTHAWFGASSRVVSRVFLMRRERPKNTQTKNALKIAKSSSEQFSEQFSEQAQLGKVEEFFFISICIHTYESWLRAGGARLLSHPLAARPTHKLFANSPNS